jgi:peptidoglycan/LPS O-acetylase OafA/YrhL
MATAAGSLVGFEADGRRTDLDWIRIGAFALLILYHVGMFYVPNDWDWHVKSRWSSEPLTLAMYLTNPWRLGLLFLVSGAATRFMVRRQAPEALARSRTARLLPPLAFGMLVVVPPQTYLEVVSYAGFTEGFTEFYARYLAGPGFFRDGERLITPTWNHLWFVTYLWVYTLALAGLLALSAGLPERLERWAERRLSGWGVLLWPVLVFAVMRLTLAPVFEQTHALVDDWYNHGQYLFLFLLGFAIARSERVWAALDRFRRPAAVLALTAYAAWASYAWAYRGDGVEPAEALGAVMRVVYAIDQWAWIAAILAYGRRWLSGRDGPVRRYLTDAIFPFYIVHQTAIVVFGYLLTRSGLPAPAEAALLIGLTAAACLATHEVVRRVGLLRPLFGLKRAEAPPPLRPALA